MMLVLIKPSTENFHLMSINVQLLEGAKLQVVVDEDAVQVFQTKSTSVTCKHNL